MQIITLTSDWNADDYYVAAMKGRILSQCPDVRISDITHQVKAWNIPQAAFILRNAFPYFPEGSIHIVSVDSEPGREGLLLAARHQAHFFLCADNGLLGLLGGGDPEKVVSLPMEDGNGSFVSMSVFAQAACRLAAGDSLDDIGENLSEFNKQVPLRPILQDNVITGSVLYIDSYGNAHTNISREVFERTTGGRTFRIYVQTKHYQIDRISSAYRDVRLGDLLAIFNTAGLLEIAMRNGNAAGLLNLSTKSTVRIEFN